MFLCRLSYRSIPKALRRELPTRLATDIALCGEYYAIMRPVRDQLSDLITCLRRFDVPLPGILWVHVSLSIQERLTVYYLVKHYFFLIEKLEVNIKSSWYSTPCLLDDIANLYQNIETLECYREQPVRRMLTYR